MNKTPKTFLLNSSLYPTSFLVFASLLLHVISPLLGETYISTGLVEGESGEVIQVPVLFETNDSIVATDIVFKFDSDGLELGEIQAGNSISNHEIYDDQSTPGELKITILSMTNDFLADGNLSILSFSLLKDYTQPTEVVSVDLSESLLVSKSATPFTISPKIEELPIDPNEDNSSTPSSPDNPDSNLVTIDAGDQDADEEPSEKLPQEHMWDLDFYDLGNGWRAFDWFGNYYQVSNSSWIYHQHLGWLYRSGDSIASTWLWSEIWGWIWTNYEAFPYLALSSGDWLYYLKGSSSPIRYYDYGLKKWSQFDFANRFNIDLSIDGNTGGKAYGPTMFNLGDTIALVAQPSPGYIFSGWKGDYKSDRNPLLLQNIDKDFSIEANFLSISELANLGFSAAHLNHLNEEEKQKAVSQVLLLGQSEYLDSGDAPVFDLFSPKNNTASSQLELDLYNNKQERKEGVFSKNSSSINHSHLSLNNQSEKIEFFMNNSKSVGIVQFIGKEDLNSVHCSIMEINASKEHFEKRWIAQDEGGNVWLIQSSINERIQQTNPTIILPKEISSGWKSWPNGFLVPNDFCILTDFPFSIRPFTLEGFQDCLAISLHRTYVNEQFEVYSPDKGLVKISK